MFMATHGWVMRAGISSAWPQVLSLVALLYPFTQPLWPSILRVSKTVTLLSQDSIGQFLFALINCPLHAVTLDKATFQKESPLYQ